MFNENYPLNACETKEAYIGQSRRPTLMETLERRQKELQSELDKTTEAISALKAAPEAMALLESLRKVSGLL